MKPTVVHQDDYGSMIVYPDDDYLGEIDGDGRDASVTARFNADGVKKLARLVPATVPLVGARDPR